MRTESVDPDSVSIRIFCRAIAYCNHKAGQWMCRTCPAPRRDASPSPLCCPCAAQLALVTPAPEFCMPLSPDDGEITACTLSSFRVGRAAQFASLSPTILQGMHGLSRVAPQPRRCEVAPDESLQRFVHVDHRRCHGPGFFAHELNVWSVQCNDKLLMHRLLKRRAWSAGR